MIMTTTITNGGAYRCWLFDNSHVNDDDDDTDDDDDNDDDDNDEVKQHF